jgi:hypothetical protein
VIKTVQVVELKPQENYLLWVKFSDGSNGVRDYADMIAAGGPMIEPLRDNAFFDSVFLSFGVPTWPNGFDFDAINLQNELKELGELRGQAA